MYCLYTPPGALGTVIGNWVDLDNNAQVHCTFGRAVVLNRTHPPWFDVLSIVC